MNSIFDLQFFDILIIFISSCLGGFVDASVGGGGFITMGGLLSAGVDGHFAIGTYKLSVVFGSLVSSYNYHKHKFINYKTEMPKIAVVNVIIGAAVGSYLINRFSSDVVLIIAPVAMITLLLYKIQTYNHGVSHFPKAKMPQSYYMAIFPFFFGLYDGFFGAGIITIWIISLVSLLGFKISKASAFAQMCSLIACSVAAIVFLINKNISFSILPITMSGIMAGSMFGSKIAIKKGPKFVNNLLLVSLSVLVLRLIWKIYTQYNG